MVMHNSMQLNVDGGCWPFCTKCSKRLVQENKCSRIDQLVISAVGLRSISPIEGTTVHLG